MADINYLLSKVGSIHASTRSKAIEIINAAVAAGHTVRFVWGMGTGSEHSTGNALDIMINNNASGDFIRDYVWANRARLRLKHVIWEQHITSTVTQPGARRLMADRGSTTENHYDHCHILFLDANAYVAPGNHATTPAPVGSSKKTEQQIAEEVWGGKWGYAFDRVSRLTKAGYNPARIQQLVNRGVGKGRSAMPSVSTKKSTAQIATEVIQGKWGSGSDRLWRLKSAGYDPTTIQAEVNRRLK